MRVTQVYLKTLKTYNLEMKNLFKISHRIRNQTTCIGENKDADQLSINCTADQHLCFHYTDSTIPLLPKSKLSSFLTFPVTVQAGLCWTCSKTPTTVFSRRRSKVIYDCHIGIDMITQECHGLIKRPVGP